MATQANPEDSRQVDRKSLSQRAYGAIRHDLMTGRYKPGEKLTLRVVADELGVSLTPAREALTRLVSESALVQLDHHSVRVPVIDADRYLEIRELRIDLEGKAAERAATHATGSDVEALEQVHKRMLSAKRARRYSDIHTENERFHMEICRLSRMHVLTRLIETLWLQCGPIFASVRGSTLTHFPAHHPHLTILEGLRERDGAKARRGIELDVERAENVNDVLNFLKSAT